MIIRCDNMLDFMEVIQGCVERGLSFEADTLGLIVKLTGGY